MSDPERESTPEEVSASTPRIWVGSLSDYNSGRLHGVWVDAAREPDELWKDIHAMLASSVEPDAEEIGIFDHDNFDGINISEWEPIEVISRLAAGVVRWGTPFARWSNYLDRNEWDERLEAFEDHYQGTWESAEAYALDYLDACGIDPDELPIEDHLQPYVTVDLAALARDLCDPFYVATDPDGTVHVFDP